MDRFVGYISFFRIIYVSVFTIRECTTQDAFVVLPKNIVGTIGQNITLRCALSNVVYSLSWRNPSGFILYEKGFGILPGFEGQYVVEESGTSYNLVVLNAESNDAGRYTCHCLTMSSSALAEIILLDSDPGLACTESTSNDDNDFGNMVEGEQVTLTCQMTYYGLWGPTQIWTNSIGEMLTPSDVSSVNIIEYTNTETVTTEDNGLRWIVHSFFSEPPIGDRDDEIPVEDDTTPPTFYYNRERPSWNEVYESNLIVVYYPVTNMNLDNVKDEYIPGEEITCAAEGNPDPEIRWVDDANATVINSHIITIEGSMEGTQTYSCLATNDVRRVTYSLFETITFNVTIPTTTTKTTMTMTTMKEVTSEGDNKKGSNAGIIGGAVGAIVFLLIVILILIGVICYLHKRTKKNEASDAPVDTVQHQYNYISEVPLRQSLSVGYVNTGTGLAEVKPSVDQQYEEIGGNQRQYPQMYSTPIQETNSEEIKKYENMPVTKEYDDLREQSRVNNKYDSLDKNDML